MVFFTEKQCPVDALFMLSISCLLIIIFKFFLVFLFNRTLFVEKNSFKFCHTTIQSACKL